MYHMNLKELTVGQPITGYYILRSGKTVTTSEGKTFYCATVLDGSGTMDVRCWQNADNSVDEKTIGEVVYLEDKYDGTVDNQISKHVLDLCGVRWRPIESAAGE